MAARRDIVTERIIFVDLLAIVVGVAGGLGG